MLNCNYRYYKKCKSQHNAHLLCFPSDGYGDCLLDDPVQSSYDNKVKRFKDIQPGQKYDVNKQCQLAFGKGYRICPFLVSLRRHDSHSL